jgi:ABC-type phosphate/phosphonate transport system substrate-binding protein
MKTMELMVFKVINEAGKTWLRLRGKNQLPKLITGVKFNDGIEQLKSNSQNSQIKTPPDKAIAKNIGYLSQTTSRSIHMNGVASLPMYDIPEVRTALDEFWRGLVRYLKREGIADIPETLERGASSNQMWDDPSLLFSQCCGYDLVHRYTNRLTPIATPHFDAPECLGADYSSVVVVAEDCPHDDVLDMAGTVCAINGPESHSGMGALQVLVAPASREGRFFRTVKVSGSHVASLALVRRGVADVAAIDSVTYTLLQRHRPGALEGLRKLGRTFHAPGVPYVTHANFDMAFVARMRTALFRLFADPNLQSVRQTLLLDKVEFLPVQAYERLIADRERAASYGFSMMN